MADIKVGDVVMLKSGGPAMTVMALQFGQDSTALCVWFDQTTDKRGAFAPEALEPYKRGGGR